MPATNIRSCCYPCFLPCNLATTLGVPTTYPPPTPPLTLDNSLGRLTELRRVFYVLLLVYCKGYNSGTAEQSSQGVGGARYGGGRASVPSLGVPPSPLHLMVTNQSSPNTQHQYSWVYGQLNLQPLPFLASYCLVYNKQVGPAKDKAIVPTFFQL